jgi:hypothetical protein
MGPLSKKPVIKSAMHMTLITSVMGKKNSRHKIPQAGLLQALE